MAQSQSTPSPRLAALLLAALLLCLAFRLTAMETLRETVSQVIGRVMKEMESPGQPRPPFVGPGFTAAYAGVCLMVAGFGAMLAARAGAFSRRHWIFLGGMGMVLALLVVSTFSAANRFMALVGTLDVAAAMAAGFGVMVLCHDRLLGEGGRRAVIAAIVAILAMNVARGYVQKFVDHPETAQYFEENRTAALQAQGIYGDTVQERMFLARLRSQEVTGFGALANVYASELIPLMTLLAALLIAAVPLVRREAPPPPPTKGEKGRVLEYTSQKPSKEIPLHVLALVAAAVVLMASFPTLYWTHSNGGVATAGLAVVVTAAAVLLFGRLFAWRRVVIAGVAVCALGGAAVVLAYGLTHDGLPSKSLDFRWHYWTASASIVKEHPAWGVGMNNFGDYYMAAKRPSSPEDVKDPHGFFVRWAAEGGTAAAVIVGLFVAFLLVGGFLIAVRPPAGDAASTPAKTTPPEVKNQKSKIKNSPRVQPHDLPQSDAAAPLVLAGAVVVGWFVLHLFIAVDTLLYNAILTGAYGVAGWAVFAAVYHLLELLAARPGNIAARVMLLAAVVGAGGMLLYDQVNMALITGPAAMLFWMLLALPFGLAAADTPARRASTLAVAKGIGLAAAGASAFVIAIMIGGETFAWDPAPLEEQYVHQVVKGQREAGLETLNRALQLSPRAVDLLMQRIYLKRDMRLPVAQDIRDFLKLDRANAQARLSVVEPDTDLPAAERIAYLEEALRFDEALAADEPKKLTAERRAEIQSLIARLRGPG